jgi:hypothetical protein
MLATFAATAEIRVHSDSGLLMIGKTVGKYEITAELGRGGHGGRV